MSDRAVRDPPEVRALAFPFFARGACAPHAGFRILRPNVPVTAGGFPVRPGEPLRGADNGRIPVPGARLGRLQEAAEEVRRGERRILDRVCSPEFGRDGPAAERTQGQGG